MTPIFSKVRGGGEQGKYSMGDSQMLTGTNVAYKTSSLFTVG